jgi:hypothetical protein
MAGVCVALKDAARFGPLHRQPLFAHTAGTLALSLILLARKQGTLGPLQLFKLDDFLSVMAKCKNLPTRWLSSSRRRRRRRNHRSLRHRR